MVILHSRLSTKKRHQIWTEISADKIDLVIGSRLAIFAPFKRLGLIIIDDEADQSLKQKQNPLYHSRDVAIFRAQQEKAPLFLFSQALSLESYYHFLKPSFNLIADHKKSRKPRLKIINLNEDTSFKPSLGISSVVLNKIKETVSKKKKILIFTMRRGSASLILCRRCQKPLQCPNCEVSLVYHASAEQFFCHHCNYQQKKEAVCFYCQETKFRFLGRGTETLEENLKKLSFKVLRLEKERIKKFSRKGLTLDNFKEESDIIIATFPFSKKLSLGGIGLVAITAIDNLINLPDFRSSEKAFQILWPIFLRCQKNSVDNLIVETYNSHHHIFQALEEREEKVFYEQELTFRKKFNYPPFSKLIRIIFEGADKEKAISASYRIDTRLKDAENNGDFELLGPAPCFIEKKKKKYLWHLLIKGNNLEPVKEILRQVSLEKIKGVKITIDVDPLELV